MSIKFSKEADMESLLEREMVEMGVCPITNSPVSSVIRQLELPGYGRCDLVKVRHGEYGTTVTVMELKNDTITPEHLEQVCRYRRGLARYLRRFTTISEFVRIEAELVGMGFDRRFTYLFQECGIGVYWLDVSFHEGIQAREVCGYYQSQERPTALNLTIRRQIDFRRKFDRAMNARSKRLSLVKGGSE